VIKIGKKREGQVKPTGNKKCFWFAPGRGAGVGETGKKTGMLPVKTAVKSKKKGCGVGVKTHKKQMDIQQGWDFLDKRIDENVRTGGEVGESKAEKNMLSHHNCLIIKALWGGGEKVLAQNGGGAREKGKNGESKGGGGEK